MNYKLRAECSEDVSEFISKTHNQMKSFSMTTDAEGLPDCELTFETDLALDEIIFTLKDIDDSQVMYQTVRHLADYTGDRDIFIE